MSQRITQKDLEAVCKRINIITGSPAVPYAKNESTGNYVAQIGCYHLSGAYGGFALHRMDNASGGVQDVLGIGHQPKKDLYHAMHAFIRGLEAQQAG